MLWISGGCSRGENAALGPQTHQRACKRDGEASYAKRSQDGAPSHRWGFIRLHVTDRRIAMNRRRPARQGDRRIQSVRVLEEKRSVSTIAAPGTVLHELPAAGIFVGLQE
jgi:hypothetical protein